MLAELSPELIAPIQSAAKLLHNAKRIAVLTGAGVSAESGVPTFRDKQSGLWADFRAEELATPSAFARDPQLVWSWYQWRRQLVHDKRPNAAHIALADLQRYKDAHQQQVTLITQNVDDLHEQAGSRAHHLHGHLQRNRCSQCDKPYEGQQDGPNNFDDHLITCSHCSGYIRPDIVWFGEALPVSAWQTAEDAAANCDVFMSIGTSSLVYPAAGLAQLAGQNGAAVIEINPNPTPNTAVNITLAAAAGIVMPPLVEQMQAIKALD